MEKKTSSGVVILATIIVIVGLLGIYVGGYFCLGEARRYTTLPEYYRLYDYEWMAVIFKPMAWIESALTGETVRTDSFV